MKKQLTSAFLLGSSFVLLCGDAASVILSAPCTLAAWWLLRSKAEQ